jgi:glycosyltransferase involved in cell wall biosynthesis
MKIIFLTYETKEIGGSYLRSLSLAEGLVKLGHQVTLWTSAKERTLFPKISFENGVEVIESIGVFPYRFRKGGYDPFDILLRTITILFSNCSIIHSFNHRPAATFPAFIKYIFSSQTKWFLDWADLWGKGGIADRRYGPFRFITANVDHYMEQLFIKLPFAITPISDDLVKKAISIRKSADHVYFLPIGANIDFIKPLPKLESRKKLKLSTKENFLLYLYVGTYDDELLFKTFNELKKIRKDTTLILLGPKLPIFNKQKKVINKGVVSREILPFYLAAADIMMLPFANKEINLGKFPNKLGDYLAAGRPIVANPTGEVKKMLMKEEIGVLVSEEPKLFAKGISDLLNDHKKMEKLGKNAREVGLKLSWTSVAKQLEGFYIE